MWSGNNQRVARGMQMCQKSVMMIAGRHDALLVVLSIFIAVFASYTALSLAGRLRTSAGRVRHAWLATAALALGGGIWSMHFVAMLSFQLPMMQVTYDLALTILSLGIAVGLTGGGLAIGTVNSNSRGRLVAAGVLMSAGVLAMHYLGMAAMEMGARLHFGPMWVMISVVIAVGASTVAVWLAFQDQKQSHRLLGSLAMGGAISGMHYAGMRAAVFTMDPTADPADAGATIGQSELAIIVAMLTVGILLIALGAARIEQLLQGYARSEAQIALRLRVADVLRDQETKDALHEVVALMGQHFKVARTGYGLLDPDQDVFEYDVCWTDGTVPPLIGRFPAAAFGEKIVAALTAGETVAVADLFADSISDEPRTRDTAREVETRAILVVPFVRGGKLRTIVYLNSRLPRQWLPDDIAFMEELAERSRLVIERAAVEDQLRELNATLEKRVEARTEELRLAQDALLQSQKMEAVGQLVSGLSHDFNNVLGAVLGAFSLIQRRPADAERVKHFAEAGAQAAERGAKLTGQLLAFSRSNKIQLQPLYVCDVILGMEDLLNRTLGPMTVLKLALNPDPQPVLADATQVEMMVLNLAINARDAMPDGGMLTIGTSVRQVPRDAEILGGQFVEIAVSDTGMGMDGERLRRAMEPFFTTKPTGKGTGLGLAQIYGSARQAGGTVRIESALGAGTTVRVFLPCTQEQPLVQPIPEVAAIEQATSAPLHILLVDDDEALRSVIAQGLRDVGHRVSEAANGDLALGLLVTECPDVAVLDFAMPGMNGAVLSQQILTRCPDLPIIFASGYADTASITNAVGEHAIILPKPYEIERLAMVIRKCVEVGNGSRNN